MRDFDNVDEGGTRWDHHGLWLLGTDAEREVIGRLVAHLAELGAADEARGADHRLVCAICVSEIALIILIPCDVVDDPANRVLLQLLHQAFLLQV